MRGATRPLLLSLCLLIGLTVLPISPISLPQQAQAQSQAEQKPAEQKPIVADAALSEQASHILNKLLAANSVDPKRIKTIQVIEEDVWNAYTDGQSIYFTKPLWQALQTEDQRAFVLSHELSHILLGHIPKTTARRVALGAFAQFVLGKYTQNKQALQQLESLTLSAIDMKFSRSMELGADERGVQLMSGAGYNTQGAIQAFEILESQSQGGPPEFLRSHPLSKSRINALSKKYGLNGQPQPSSGNTSQFR